MTPNVTLSDFLFDRIAEDEAEMPYLFSEGEWFGVNGVAVDLRTRVLAECEAKRRIVEAHKELPERGDFGAECVTCLSEDWPCRTMRALALPYADNPDYDETWRP